MHKELLNYELEQMANAVLSSQTLLPSKPRNFLSKYNNIAQLAVIPDEYKELCKDYKQAIQLAKKLITKPMLSNADAGLRGQFYY